MVRLPAETPASKLHDVVERMMIPYKESGCGDHDPPELKQYMVFKDLEDEYLKEYDFESTERIVMEDGSLVEPWDERFRVPGSFGTGSDTHRAPAHMERREVPFKTLFKTFDEFTKEWHGCSQRDPKMKRHGYWHNPNQKWDYWRIGGRWRGDLLVKKNAPEAGLGEQAWEFKPEFHKGKVPGGETEVDYCRIDHLNWPLIHTMAQEKVEKFWSEVDAFLSGKEFEVFSGPRDAMLRLGMLDCLDASEITKEMFWKRKWPRQNTPGVDRFDVVKAKPDRAVLHQRLLEFFNPLRPWARLDHTGWYEPGEMGWWGMSSATPESEVKHAQSFSAWIHSGDRRDWIVMLDCHI
jgi:hypothetical protein